MATFTLQKEFTSLPIVLALKSFQFVPEYSFHLDEIREFFLNREGSRIYYPEWGFNFRSKEEPYEVEELRALILLKMDQFFSYIEVSEVRVSEISFGEFLAEITIEQSSITQTITLEFV